MRNGTCAAVALLALAACDGAPKPAPAAKPPVVVPLQAPRVEAPPVPELPERPTVPEVPAPAPTPAATPQPSPVRLRDHSAFRDGSAASAIAKPFVVLQEIKQMDVRDTKRAFNPVSGVMEEVPSEGTVNPAKVRQNELWRLKGQHLAQREARLLTELERRFREEFAQALGLPAPDDRELFVFVAWNESSFSRILAELRQPQPAFARAVFLPPTAEAVTYVGDESLQSRDVQLSDDGFAQKESDQALLYAAIVQLFHESASILRGAPPAVPGASVVDSGPQWFWSGLADLMCSVDTKASKLDTLADPQWRHERVRPDLVDAARRSREAAGRWTIERMLQPVSSAERLSLGRQIAPGSSEVASLFAVRSWAFCHFLRHYDSGKYAKQFLEWFRVVMTGEPTPDAFAKIMGRPGASDWGPVEREFEWYWKELLRHRGGRDVLTREQRTPSTDPPEGRVEDDQDFCDVWEQREMDRAARKAK